MATGYDTRLLSPQTDEPVEDRMTPEAALRLVARIRGVKFFMHFQMHSPLDGDDEHMHELISCMDLTAAQVRKLLDEMRAANERRAKLGRPAVLVKVVRMSRCMFFGGT